MSVLKLQHFVFRRNGSKPVEGIDTLLFKLYIIVPPDSRNGSKPVEGIDTDLLLDQQNPSNSVEMEVSPKFRKEKKSIRYI